MAAAHTGAIRVHIRQNRREPVAFRPRPDEIQPPPAAVRRDSERQCLLGPRVLYRPLGAAAGGESPLCKWALQRLGNEALQRSRCPHLQKEPFEHHWVCEVRIADGDDDRPRREGYTLEVRAGPPTLVRIDAESCWGAIHAFSTLRQMIRVDVLDTHTVCYTEGEFTVEDRPACAHRGVLVDCIETFVPLPKLRQLINMMAFFKMNVLHWPLATPRGQRLTDSPSDISRYTFEDIVNIYYYAKRRGIDVMVEYNPSTEKAEAYAKQVRDFYIRVPQRCPLRHLGGDEGLRAGQRLLLDTVLTEHDPEAAAAASTQIHRHLVDAYTEARETLRPEPGALRPPPGPGEVHRQTRDVLRQLEAIERRERQIVLWARSLRRAGEAERRGWGHLVVQGDASAIDDHPIERIIHTPPVWHVDRDEVIPPPLERFAEVRAPPGAMGGEICFWKPGTPSFIPMTALVSRSLWCGERDTPVPSSETLGHLAQLMVSHYRPVEPVTGHAMDMRDMKNVDTELLAMLHRARRPPGAPATTPAPARPEKIRAHGKEG